MNDIYLVTPAMKYKDSFYGMINEYFLNKEMNKYDAFKPALKDFSQYIEKLEELALGINVPEKKVATDTYWLADSRNFIYGTLRIRKILNEDFYWIGGHIGYDIAPSQRNKGYGTLILKLALEKLTETSLEKVLLTCNIDNIGSRKIIEKNGGELENVIHDEDRGKEIARYWIRIK